MTQTFATEIDKHLATIEDLCRQAGMPQWADHVTLVLGDPQDLQHTVLFGYQDLDALLLLVQYLKDQAAARQHETSTAHPPSVSPGAPA